MELNILTPIEERQHREDGNEKEFHKAESAKLGSSGIIVTTKREHSILGIIRFLFEKVPYAVCDPRT